MVFPKRMASHQGGLSKGVLLYTCIGIYWWGVQILIIMLGKTCSEEHVYNNGDNCCFTLPEPGSCCKRPAISKHLYSDLSMTGINTERQLAQMRLITCNVIDGSELTVLFISSLLTSFNINTCYTPCQVEHLWCHGCCVQVTVFYWWALSASVYHAYKCVSCNLHIMDLVWLQTASSFSLHFSLLYICKKFIIGIMYYISVLKIIETVRSLKRVNKSHIIMYTIQNFNKSALKPTS